MNKRDLKGNTKMKKILFDVDVLDKHYCIYLDEETIKLLKALIKNI